MWQWGFAQSVTGYGEYMNGGGWRLSGWLTLANDNAASHVLACDRGAQNMKVGQFTNNLAEVCSNFFQCLIMWRIIVTDEQIWPTV